MHGHDFYCLNCTKFGQLILRNIIKIVATRCQILRLKHFISQGHAITLLARLLADTSPPTVPVSGRSHAVDSDPLALYLLQ